MILIQDKIETFGNGSVIQHGKHNDRIYLIKLVKLDLPEIFQYFEYLINKEKYTKIFCKVPQSVAPVFISNGFISEAFIPSFFKEDEDVFFMSKFINSDRIMNIENDKLLSLSNLLSEKFQLQVNDKPDNFEIKKLTTDHIYPICELYRQVFNSYPFPIFDPEYIRKTMEEDVFYFGAFINNSLVAMSSAETDFSNCNAEMTDFATLPAQRGKKLSVFLLHYMENVMRKKKIKILYTIARLNSIAMNKTFLKLGYNYSGTLIKNTNISGNIESMNVYYKKI